MKIHFFFSNFFTLFQGYNSKLRHKKVLGLHPNVYLLSSVIKDELNEANDDGHTASIGKQVRRPKSQRLQTLKREKLAAMRNLKERKVSLRNYMKRIGSLSEKYDRRAQAEGFTKKREGDSDAEFSENEDIPIQKSQQKIQLIIQFQI